MNTALALLAHALRMLVFDTAATLRVILPALLVVLGGSLTIALYVPDILTVLESPTLNAGELADNRLGLFTLAGTIMLLGYAYMAILWHRHVLLNDATAAAPGGAVFFGYVWRAIVVGLAQIVIAIPATLVLGTLGAMTGGAAALTGIVGLLGSLFFIWIALRLSVVLPAAALGYAMPLRESWALTRPLAAPLVGLGSLLVGLNVLIYAITNAILPDQGLVTMMAGTVIFILEGLIFVSVLTTLYGHLVEGRSLGQ